MRQLYFMKYISLTLPDKSINTFTVPLIFANLKVFFNFYFPESRTPSRVFTLCLHNIWQDARIRTRVAATAGRCAANVVFSLLLTSPYTPPPPQVRFLFWTAIVPASQSYHPIIFINYRLVLNVASSAFQLGHFYCDFL